MDALKNSQTACKIVYTDWDSGVFIAVLVLIDF